MRVRTPPPAEGAGQRRAETEQGTGPAPIVEGQYPQPSGGGPQASASTGARVPAPTRAAQPALPGEQDGSDGEARHVCVEAGQPILIGSAPENQVVVDDPQVAPRQARIDVNPKGQTIITDLAHNGATLVNGIPVQRVPLMAGAEVRLGQRRFVFTGHDLVEYDAARDVRVDALHLRQSVPAGFLGLGRKVLLDDISLTLMPGTFVVIVGASGAGKTTLLRALSGQAPTKRGNVLYNGLNLVGHRHQFCNTLGYVPQDDIVHKNLTVEKALYYAGRLRLPKGTPRREVWERVDEVLDDVELTGQSKQLISQLSGGQRKRVNIALELLGHPAIFYLDEPTSGLDPGLDLKMMEMLRRLADRGQTVVLVTHATNNVDLCDYVCFLAPNGKLAYYGPPEGLKRFFRTDNYASIYNALYDDPDHWVQLFRQSPDFLQYVDSPRLQSENLVHNDNDNDNDNGDAERKREGAAGETSSIGRARQFSLLTRRYLHLLSRDHINLLILLLQAPIIAGLVTMLAEKNCMYNVMHPASPGAHTDFYAQRTLFIMVCSAIWFGIINAAREIVKEGPIYRRERAVNLRIGPYVLSKVIVLGVLCAVQCATLLGIVGLKAGYPTSGLIWPGRSGAIAELYISLLFCALVGLMLGLMVSALAPTTDRAVSIVPIVLIPQIIFSSVIFSLSGPAGKVISYFMPSRWGMQATGSITRISDKFAEMDLAFYRADVPHLLGFWAALVGLAIFFWLLTQFFMRWKDTD